MKVFKHVFCDFFTVKLFNNNILVVKNFIVKKCKIALLKFSLQENCIVINRNCKKFKYNCKKISL